MLAVLIAGVVAGWTYALAGAALAIAYRASRILNFALGGMGGLGAYVCYSVLTAGNAPWVLGFAAALASGAAMGVLGEIFVARPLSRTSHLTAAIGMLGVLLIFQGLIEAIWGNNPAMLPAAAGAAQLRVGAVSLQVTDLVTVFLSAVACALLLFLLYRTSFGLQMRAASSGPVTAQTLGVRVSLASTAGWAIGGALGAASAVFVLPAATLEPPSYAAFLFLALIALVVGGLTSIGGVMTGGLVFGVVLGLMEAYFSTRLTYTFAYLFLAALLLIRPQGLLGRPEVQVVEPNLIVRARRGGAGFRRFLSADPIKQALSKVRIMRAAAPAEVSLSWRRASAWTGGVLVLAVMIALWWGPPLITLSLPAVVSTFIAVVGLDILVGYCGQWSLAQGAFTGVGAYAGALAIAKLGVPALAALPTGALAGAVVGVLVGLPAIRLSHLYFAQITLLFAFVVPELIILFGDVTGGVDGIALTLPSNINGFGEYLLYLAIALVVVVVVMSLLRSQVGRHWRGIRDNELVARGLGQQTTFAKMGAFALGCGLAGLAGAMQGLAVGTISPDSYPVWLSVYLKAALITGGTASLLGNLVGAFFVTVVPLYTQRGGLPPDLVFGIVFVTVMLLARRGVGGVLEDLWHGAFRSAAYAISRLIAADRGRKGSLVGDVRPALQAGMLAQSTGSLSWAPSDSPPQQAFFERGRSGAVTPTLAGTDHGQAWVRGSSAQSPTSETGGLLLRVHDLHAGYRGGEVLHGLNLQVMKGQAVGVVGPNGAGKSTLLRSITGLLPPKSGQILYQGEEITSLPGWQIARKGIANVVEGRGIFPELTVEENLRLGRLHGGVDGTRSDEIMVLFPSLRERLRQLAGTLSGGQQQMLAVARSLVSQPTLLILDEPLLGLAPAITALLIDALKAIRKTGVSILIVEQNIRQVFSVCDLAYVLAAGQVVAAGEPSALEARSDLVETYFGLTGTRGPEGAAGVESRD